MSDSPPRLPARPSLEQLRKQAKDLLRRGRAGDAEALAALGADARPFTLADAQRAVARAHGLASWTKLRAEVDKIRPPGLERYERMAAELAAAYGSGDAVALRELNWTYGTDFRRDTSAAALQRQLPTWFASASRDPALALADARGIVARNFGFESWEALAAGRGSRRGSSAEADAAPAFCTIDAAEGGLWVEGPLTEADWEKVAALLEERGLTRLTARGIDDAGMKRVARAASLTHLDVLDSKLLTDEGAAALAGLGQLEELAMGGWPSPLTDRALAPLRRIRRLRRFRTAWTAGFSDAGMAALAGCEALEEANLLGTPSGDGALRALAGKAKLRRLTTGRCVTDEGLALIAELPVFSAWRGGAARYDLMGTEADPNQLVVDGPITDAGLLSLARLEGLFALSFFQHATAFGPRGVESLRALPHLAVLGCDGGRCDDRMMRAIAGLPRLRKLIAQGAVASDEGFAALAGSRTLEYLWGRQCPNFSSRGFAALAEMPALRGLAVSCARVSDEALALLPSFPALRELVPIDVHDEGFRHVGQCSRLEHLWCMYCRDTGDAATAHIAGLRLKSYYAGMARITDTSLELLAAMRSLERVQLWHCDGVREAGVAAIAALPRLRELVLQGLPRVPRSVARRFREEVRIRWHA